MMNSSMVGLPIVFFCCIGWICAGPAIGADDKGADDKEADKKEGEGFFSEQDEPGAERGVESGSAAEEPATGQEDNPGISVKPAGSRTELFGPPSPADPLVVSAYDVSDQIVEVKPFDRIELHIQEQDIIKVLKMLAIQSLRNILPSPSVSGQISAALYDVDFYEALDAILHTNGFGYIEEGNFIKVYTAAELAAIQESRRRLVNRVVRLNYMTASDAAKFLTPLITPKTGSITVSADPPAGINPTISMAGEKSFANVDTLLIRDFPEVVEEMLELIKQLDVRPPQIQIEATILEVKLSEDNTFGVDISILADFDLDEFTNPLNPIGDLLNGSVGGHGQVLQSTPGKVATGSASVKFGVISSSFSAFIRALDQVTDTTVLANPTLLTLNRQSAKLISGQKLGYISTTATETSTTQTVEFLEVGTQLLVRPFVTEDDFIRLELRPEISEGEVRSVQGFVIPDETTNELIANVIVPNGKTIVLGGLFKEDTTVTRTQVPGIGDLPVVGAAFKRQEDVVRRSEVIFLVRPTIIRAEALTEAGDRVGEGIEMARMGSRDGLLPWSRSRLSASHLSDAHRFLSEGRKDQALLSVNMALMLDPTLIEGMRLKNELTGERLYGPDRGLLGDTIKKLIDDQLNEEKAEKAASLYDEARATPVEAEAETVAAAVAGGHAGFTGYEFLFNNGWC